VDLAVAAGFVRIVSLPLLVFDPVQSRSEFMSINPHESEPPERRGVIAVVTRGDRFLVIRRSATVAAPRKFCFPGGGIEGTESEPEAKSNRFIGLQKRKCSP
jgi:hypothetical protein